VNVTHMITVCIALRHVYFTP